MDGMKRALIIVGMAAASAFVIAGSWLEMTYGWDIFRTVVDNARYIR